MTEATLAVATLTPRMQGLIVNRIAAMSARHQMSAGADQRFYSGKVSGAMEMLMTIFPYGDHTFDLIALAEARVPKLLARAAFNKARHLKQGTCPECEHALTEVRWDQATKLICVCGWNEWVDVRL